MPQLLVIQGNDLGKQFVLEGQKLSIGRDPKNEIHLRDQEVSRAHAIIKLTDEGHLIEDQKSSNGTYINDRKLKQHVLSPRDLIRIGQTTLLYETKPLESRGDARDLVTISSEDTETESRIIETINAKVALPSYEEDSQITDSFLEQLEENIHVIYHTAVATSRYTDIDELHQKVLQLIFDWVKADRGCVMLFDEETEVVTPVAFRKRDEHDETETIEISRSILEYVREKNEGVLTSDAQQDERWYSGASIAKGGTVEAMCVPMHGRMGVVGFVYVDNYIPPASAKKKQKGFEQRFSQQQLKMLLAIAHQAALATENAIYYTAMTQNAQLAAVGETFTQIAHHLRNMLQGLDDAKNRVNRGLEREKLRLIKEGWSEIEPITTRIYNLSLNLLSFSKPREPEMALESLNDAVVDVIRKVEKRAMAKGITLDWEPNMEVKPFAFDSEGIYRAVLNVVHNAIDACTKDCVIKVRISEAQDQDIAEISVIDDGEGIEPDKIELIFKPFASTKGEMGTGIGLPVSRKILREHGGDIDVSSAVGHGSRFTMFLPIRRAKSKRQPKIDTSMYKARKE